MKNVTLLFFILTFLLVPGGVGAEPIRFCRPNNMISALAYLAEERKFFDRHNVEVEFQTASNGKICQDSLIAERTDIANYAEGPFLFVAHQKPSISIVARIGTNSDTGLLMHGETSIAELKGKRLGVLPGTVSIILLGKVLQNAKLQFSDISTVPLQAPTMPMAFAGGQVDGVSIWEPWLSQARSLSKGNSTVLGREPSIYAYDSLVYVHSDYLKDNPKNVENVLLALNDAMSYVKREPEASGEFLAKVLTLPESVLKESWGLFRHELDLRRESVTLMEDGAAILRAYSPKQFPQEEINYASFFDLSVLRRVAPDGVDW